MMRMRLTGCGFPATGGVTPGTGGGLACENGCTPLACAGVGGMTPGGRPGPGICGVRIGCPITCGPAPGCGPPGCGAPPGFLCNDCWSNSRTPTSFPFFNVTLLLPS